MNEKENIPTNPQKPVPTKEQGSRKEIHRRKASSKARRKRLILYTAEGILFCGLLMLVILTATNGFGLFSKPEILNGNFVYNLDTVYQFDGKGKGCMCITDGNGEHHYEYGYTVRKDKLRIDFEAKEVRDATYTFILEGDELTLTGGEGTIGGIYMLTRDGQ